MNTDKISESGRINENGQLLMPMDRLNAFFKAHKGQRVTIRFYFNAPGSTAAQQSYYYQYIVPTIQQALRETGERKSEKGVDKWLIEQYPGDKGDYQLGVDYEVSEARHLTQWQMSEFLEWLKQYAAENLAVYIEDPRTI